MLADTHCHLDDGQFDGRRAEIVEQAQQAGLKMILDPSTTLESSRQILDLAHRFELVYGAVGVQPNYANTWQADAPEQLRAMAADEKVLAIGEIGLDYYWDRTEPQIQQEVLAAQLELAAELNLPVIIHNREADDDVSDALCQWQASLDSDSPLADRPGVFHSFSGSPSMAEKVLAHNFFIGITGPVTFKKADQLREIVKAAPAEKLLIETDSPYLSPEPHRGKPNQPAHVRFVADKIAEIKGLERQDFYMQSTRNAERLFAVNLIQ